MATVAVRAKDETADRSTIVTTKSFRSWKRKQGRGMAFVVQLPGADDDEGVLVCTLSEMRRLPAGQHYQARLVRRCAIIDPSLKKQLRGSDVWKCV
mgnify:CR=1 FL=1